MRYHTLALAAAFCLLPGLTPAQVIPPARSPVGSAPTADPTTTTNRALTLEQAWARAHSASTTLHAKQAQLVAAEGLATDAASWLANNPQVSAERTRRSVPSSSATERRNEWSAGVSQAVEIAGQPGHRREAANAALQALRLEIDDMVRQQRAEVSERFYRVLALQQRVEIEAQAMRLFEDSARAVEKRRGAGEDTRLDANVAVVEAERARNQLATVQEQLLDARAALATALQLPPSESIEASGSLSPSPLGYSLEVLLQSVPALPRLQALNAREQSAQAKLRLERAARYPDVTVGMNVGREGPGDARERLTTFTVSVPLPLFKHNAAGIGQASTELAQAQIERRAAERDLPAQVHALWTKLQSLQNRIERLQRSVLPALADNERLSVKSRQAGQIGLLELIVTTRQTLDARRDLVDALLDYQTTRTALEAAAGWPAQL
ncbi:TolC family protein [Piscinibacter terrae]|uniref:TolC family protein n=1 Tax=Piscinibacter terrae TaxID=2496871 RepID=A0A3N7HII0_9BURK|nr:TolC family protein [Albitalea terrae]RQP21850.1 TolC family protein [Albitalea terrae]